MIRINYPAPDFKIKAVQNRDYIWDNIRKKWIIITPEEWVRQNFIHYLIVEKKIPREVIAIEKAIMVGDLKKRYDIVVFRRMKPWIIVECKEPGTPLKTAVLEQVVRYNMKLAGAFLVISNGLDTKGWQVSNGSFEELSFLPNWPDT